MRKIQAENDSVINYNSKLKDKTDFTNKLRVTTYFLIPFLIGVIIKIIIFNNAIINHGNLFIGNYSSELFWDIQNVEFYDDFNYYSLNFVNYFLSGELPYTHFFYINPEPNAFMTYGPLLIYPPLYLYIISMFGNNLFWNVALPVLIFDILTSYLVFKISFKLWKNRIFSVIACLIYLLNPLNIIYIDYYWLNTSIFTFFLMVSIYFLIDDRFYLSILFLSLSIMCKQFAGIFLIIILIRMSKRMQDLKLSKIVQFKKYIKTLSFLFIPIALFSLPYILPYYPDFPDYIFHILAVGGFDFNLNLPSYSVPIDFSIPFIALELNYNFLYIIKWIIEYYVLLIGITILICCIYSFFIKRNKFYNKNTLIITLILLISMTLFFPRGFYKYYTILFIPLMSILIMKNLKNHGWNHWKNNSSEIIIDIISIGIYFFFSISILYIHRYFTPLLLLSMIIYYSFYGYVNFSLLLKKVFRIYSRIIYKTYEKYQDRITF